MKYIDKQPHLDQGHEITDNYLNGWCRVDGSDGHYSYINIDYDGSFRSSSAKDQMRELALANQSNFCCYCMRDLGQQNQKMTLEHIIPQSCSTADFSRYTSHSLPFFSSNEIIHTDSFKGVQDISVPPRPHTVTFENLVASCDGTFPDKVGSCQCCNGKRKESEIYPLFYQVNIERELEYKNDGTILPAAGTPRYRDYLETIGTIGLNCTNLKDIRRLWHLFEDVDISELAACLHDGKKRDELLWDYLYKVAGQEDQDNRTLQNFRKKEYWKTFLLYHWFQHHC